MDVQMQLEATELHLMQQTRSAEEALATARAELIQEHRKQRTKIIQENAQRLSTAVYKAELRALASAAPVPIYRDGQLCGAVVKM